MARKIIAFLKNHKEESPMNHYTKGLKSGLPVGLGYFSVSFAFGVAAVQKGLPVLTAVLISLTNLTSAGQVAGLDIIALGGGYLEMAVTQLIINLRYALMSISLSQKLDPSVRMGDRFVMAFGVTDENFAIAVAQPKTVTARDFFGLMTLPILCWTGGTLLGAAAASGVLDVTLEEMEAALAARLNPKFLEMNKAALHEGALQAR
jgi:predicted branched-subunit amino acid permease